MLSELKCHISIAHLSWETEQLGARAEVDSAYQLMEEIAPSTRILVEPFITPTQIDSRGVQRAAQSEAEWLGG